MQNNNTLTVPPFYDMQFTDKDGRLTADAKLYNDLINKILIANFNQSLTPPSATTPQITKYSNDVSVGLGAVWYNTDINKLQLKVGAGTVETITSS